MFKSAACHVESSQSVSHRISVFDESFIIFRVYAHGRQSGDNLSTGLRIGLSSAGIASVKILKIG